jgi:hypothetical protein
LHIDYKFDKESRGGMKGNKEGVKGKIGRGSGNVA